MAATTASLLVAQRRFGGTGLAGSLSARGWPSTGTTANGDVRDGGEGGSSGF